jgi:uncharacterized protein
VTGKRIIIGGASGMLGKALTAALEDRGDTVVPLVRQATLAESGQAAADSIVWGPRTGSLDAEKVRGAAAVVVLNGVGIGDKRWNEERKQAIKSSRVDAVGTAARTLATLGPDGPALVAASAIGIYGDRGDEILDETSSPGDDFLAGVCTAWEAAAQPARDAGVRVANMRTGIVVAKGGGALAPMVPLFKLGIGGRIGDGSQWWSWVSEADTIGGYLAAIDGVVTGPVNLVAPNPVTNPEFTKALGSVLHRPTFIPVPKLGLKIRLGSELAEAIGYGSQRVKPVVLDAAGYEFVYPDLEGALEVALA